MTDFIRDYWDGQARTHGASPEASWGDQYAMALEIETIAAHMQDGATVLDVGCANGYPAFKQLERRKPRKLVGVDFSPAMVAAALEGKAARDLGDRVEFREADVRALPFPDAAFDLVYTTRTLINLPSWEEQARGVAECVRVARRGGKVVLSEAFWEPLQLLNALRALKQLPPLVEHDFNRYLKKSRLEEYLRSLRLPFEVEEFSSVYYLGSRFLRELVTDPSAYPGYSNPINRLFYDMEREYSGGGFGIQQAYVIRKP